MSDEKDERLLFIVGDELPALKRLVKTEADKQDTSSTELMVRTLCDHFGIVPPPRQRRPARDVQDSESLALAIPTVLWQSIHQEAGAQLVSKKEIVLRILRGRFE